MTVSRLVECLPHKHGDLGLHCQHPRRKLGMALHTCNPSAWEIEAFASQVF